MKYFNHPFTVFKCLLTVVTEQALIISEAATGGVL